MEQYFYAQLDDEGVCMAASQLSGEVDAPNMIQITEQQFINGVLNKRFDSGQWRDVEQDGKTEQQ